MQLNSHPKVIGSKIDKNELVKRASVGSHGGRSTTGHMLAQMLSAPETYVAPNQRTVMFPIRFQ